MIKRLELQTKLLQYTSNVYFQPPSNVRMNYPCIVYRKSTKDVYHADDHIYKSRQQYTLTIMDFNPEAHTADRILEDFQYASLGDYFVVDNLNQTIVKLYY